MIDFLVYEKLNEPINVAIAYDQFSEDQKILKSNSTLLTQELSQAYKYLANFYLKKMKLDNAYDAATKCLEFAETRQEAQSILSQIAQSRNALREQEQSAAGSSANVDMEMGTSRPSQSDNLLNANQVNERALSPSLIALDNSDNPNINDTNTSMMNFAPNQMAERNQAASSSSELPTNSNSSQIQHDIQVSFNCCWVLTLNFQF
ncbi:cell division cycle 23 -like protein [Brachionus plicatilis]|uniref:Cell division cycle 23-like protein n=1 Tax=Brachionus plicatilis TaxID=10195 RepID=A0A3M7SH46_BRAPC|nr:cell division cycle 23 -like protein [Brachionus plicatilis]